MFSDVKPICTEELRNSWDFLFLFYSDKKYNWDVIIFSEEQLFWNADYYNQWRKTGKRNRSTKPGHGYFEFIDEMMSSHLEIGELYFEFRKCVDDNCSFCISIPGDAPEPVPRPKPNLTTQRYEKYEDTTGHEREVDDYQPRKQCKLKFEQEDIGSAEKIREFCSEFLVSEDLVKEHVRHLTDLKRNAEKRKQENQRVQTAAMIETDEDEETVEVEVSRKKKRGRKRKRSQTVVVEDQEEEENSQEESSDDENDIILNIIQGSDDEEDGDTDQIVVIPRLKTVTRHGRVAGTWQRHFQPQSSEDTDSSDEDIDDLSDKELSSESDTESVAQPKFNVRKRTAPLKTSQVNNTDDSDEEDNSTINNQDRPTTRRGRAIKVPTRYQS